MSEKMKVIYMPSGEHQNRIIVGFEKKGGESYPIPKTSENEFFDRTINGDVLVYEGLQ